MALTRQRVVDDAIDRTRIVPEAIKHKPSGPSSTEQACVDALVDEIVASIPARQRRRVGAEDLAQTAHLAVLEARLEMPHLSADHDRDYLAWLMRQAIDELLTQSPGPASVDLERADRVGLPDLRVGDVGDEVVERTDAVSRVHRMLGGIPADTAEIVRMIFGLGGRIPVRPISVARRLGLPVDEIEGHLWVAERLFRHFSDDGRDRRDQPLSEREFQAFRQVGDLAWYDLRDLNLNNADLGRCDLTQAVLSGMNLWGLKLFEARATGINLWGSQLDGGDLRGADLRLGYLERTSLCGADLRWADLSGANLWGADLSSATADYTDLREADLRSANLVGANLTGANLAGADLRKANLRRARLVGTDLQGANLQGADLRGADLRWADLGGADLCWLDLSMTDLRGASMQGAIRSPKLESLMARRVPRPERDRPLAASA